MKVKILITLIILVVLAGIWLGFRFIIDKSPAETVACTMDAKLCPDGSYVSRIPPKCDFALCPPEALCEGGVCPKEDLIQVESPMANETISSPLIVKGKARGFWFFEASFPVKLLDADGNLLAQSIAQAQGEWMTEDFVPFEATLDFEAPATNQGLLILEKDNPSGLPENADELRMPILFSNQEVKTKTIKLYYYNSDLDKDKSGNTACSRNGLVAAERKIPTTQTPIQDTIRLLLSGELTDKERAQRISTEYPLEGFSSKGASLKDGVLTLEFDDSKNKTVGGSCRVGILWFQIEATAKQFPEVKQVRFLPEEIFQP